MNKMIIFLDIDGVLVTRRSCIPCGHSILMSSPDPCGANLIKELCIKNDAKIVVSSTWRYNPKDLFELLKKVGIEDHFIFKCEEHLEVDKCWRTPLTCKNNETGKHSIRGEEIKSWLAFHKCDESNSKYVIFDDDSDFLEEQKQFHLKTSFDDGILIDHFRRAAKIFGHDKVI